MCVCRFFFLLEASSDKDCIKRSVFNGVQIGVSAQHGAMLSLLGNSIKVTYGLS